MPPGQITPCLWLVLCGGFHFHCWPAVAFGMLCWGGGVTVGLQLVGCFVWVLFTVGLKCWGALWRVHCWPENEMIGCFIEGSLLAWNAGVLCGGFTLGLKCWGALWRVHCWPDMLGCFVEGSLCSPCTVGALCGGFTVGLKYWGALWRVKSLSTQNVGVQLALWRVHCCPKMLGCFVEGLLLTWNVGVLCGWFTVGQNCLGALSWRVHCQPELCGVGSLGCLNCGSALWGFTVGLNSWDTLPVQTAWGWAWGLI